MKLSGRVEYKDGSVAEFVTGSAALAAYELWAVPRGMPVGADAPPMTTALFVAHHALEIAEGFEAWRAGVADVELDAHPVDPTLPAATDDNSVSLP